MHNSIMHLLKSCKLHATPSCQFSTFKHINVLKFLYCWMERRYFYETLEDIDCLPGIVEKNVNLCHDSSYFMHI